MVLEIYNDDISEYSIFTIYLRVIFLGATDTVLFMYYIVCCILF